MRVQRPPLRDGWFRPGPSQIRRARIEKHLISISSGISHNLFLISAPADGRHFFALCSNNIVDVLVALCDPKKV